MALYSEARLSRSTVPCCMQGYALVEFESFKEAKKAKEEMNGSPLLGKVVNVDWAFGKGTVGRLVLLCHCVWIK